jgi:uncharacterized protein
VKQVLGDRDCCAKLNPKDFTDETFGVPTVPTSCAELEKPGRDPRPEFKTATFQEGVEDIKTCKPGMVLEGVVTNVAAFGAFVDIGVHQDGLVHISQLSRQVRQGPARGGEGRRQVVKVKVLRSTCRAQAHRADRFEGTDRLHRHATT